MKEGGNDDVASMNERLSEWAKGILKWYSQHTRRRDGSD